MIHDHLNEKTNGVILLRVNESRFEAKSFTEKAQNLLTIAWNRGDRQTVKVDDKEYVLEKEGVIVFNANQTFSFEKPDTLVAWQFNREFYCIIDHDQEVSCVGLLFYGHREVPIIQLDQEDQRKLDMLLQVFIDEYAEEDDNLKTEMLQVILKRLIVKLTRTYKKQTKLAHLSDNEMGTVRQFNLLVEQNFKKMHQVQDYADLIHKSPKTISNIFSQYSTQSPLEIIHNRIMLEAKRLLIYTDLTAKEIAYSLGFDDIPNFSRFFKKYAQLSPSQYRIDHKNRFFGKN